MKPIVLLSMLGCSFVGIGYCGIASADLGTCFNTALPCEWRVAVQSIDDSIITGGFVKDGDQNIVFDDPSRAHSEASGASLTVSGFKASGDPFMVASFSASGGPVGSGFFFDMNVPVQAIVPVSGVTASVTLDYSISSSGPNGGQLGADFTPELIQFFMTTADNTPSFTLGAGPLPCTTPAHQTVNCGHIDSGPMSLGSGPWVQMLLGGTFGLTPETSLVGTVSVAVNQIPVPEPSVIAMLFAGVGLLACFVSRRAI